MIRNYTITGFIHVLRNGKTHGKLNKIFQRKWKHQRFTHMRYVPDLFPQFHERLFMRKYK